MPARRRPAATAEPSAPAHAAARRSRTARASSAPRPRSCRSSPGTGPSARSSASIFSGLVRLGPGNTYEPDLAESWTTDAKGKTWTFTIRDDATWQDGVPVTADDVVYTVEALKSPDAVGRDGRRLGRRDGDGDRREDRRSSSSRRPSRGFLAAATQPLLPAHLLLGRPVRRPRDERVRAGAGRHRALRADRARRHDGRARAGVAHGRPGRLADARADAVARRARHARPDGAAARGRPADRADRGPLLSRRRDRGRRVRDGRRSTRSPACCRPSPTTLATAAGRRPPALPDDDARDRPAQPAPDATRSCATCASARRCSGRSTATRSSPTRSAGTASRAGRARAAVVVGVRRRRRAACRSTEGGGQGADRTRAGRRRTASGRPRAPRRPYKLELLTRAGRRRTRGSRRSPTVVARGLDGLRDRRRRRRDAGRRPRDQAPRAGLHGGGPRHHDRPRAGPLPAARVEPGARRRDEPHAATRTRPWTRCSRPPASPPSPPRGWPPGRRCSPGWRPGSRSCRSPGTTKACSSRGVDGTPTRLIDDPGDRFWDVLAWRLAADR